MEIFLEPKCIRKSIFIYFFVEKITNSLLDKPPKEDRNIKPIFFCEIHSETRKISNKLKSSLISLTDII